MTDVMDPGLAPGCFGSPLIFNGTHAVCSTCAFITECRPKAAVRLAVLHAHFGIAAPAPAVAAPLPPPRLEVGGVLISKKAMKTVDRVEAVCSDFKSALLKGVNPIVDKTKRVWLRIACDVLLEGNDGMTKDDLILAYTTKLDWGRETAIAHANHALQVFTAIGATLEIDGRFSIRRD
jgi:hypothetical protein